MNAPHFGNKNKRRIPEVKEKKTYHLWVATDIATDTD